MKKISVIAVTARMGCFDVLVHGLASQSMDKADYEVIIVDSCYKERRGACPGIRSALPSNFYHLELPAKYDYYDACYANNFGASRASGELLVFFSDLNWPEPKFLERHWQIYTNFPGYSMTGYCDRYPVPRLWDNLNWRYHAWSVFQSPFFKSFAEKYFAETPIEYAERKGGVRGAPVLGSPYFELPGEFFYGALNESIPKAVWKELGGWDEIYDGGYSAADIDLGTRANMIGWKFLIYPNSINNKLGTKGTSGHIPGVFKPTIRQPHENLALYQWQMEAIKSGKRKVRSLIGV